MGLDKDVQGELNSAAGGFYQPYKNLTMGESEEIVVTRYAKYEQTKYPIKDKSGASIGYTWRFWLSDGRVWDVSNRNRKVLLQGLHPGGREAVVPGRFTVTQVGNQGTKAPSQTVVYLGRADEAPAPQAGEAVDDSFTP